MSQGGPSTVSNRLLAWPMQAEPEASTSGQASTMAQGTASVSSGSAQGSGPQSSKTSGPRESMKQAASEGRTQPSGGLGFSSGGQRSTRPPRAAMQVAVWSPASMEHGSGAQESASGNAARTQASRAGTTQPSTTGTLSSEGQGVAWASRASAQGCGSPVRPTVAAAASWHVAAMPQT